MALSVAQTQPFMLANSVPQLQNLALCEFLGNIDEREVAVLHEESDRLLQQDRILNIMLDQLNQAYSWTNIFRGAACVAAGVSVPTALAPLIKEKAEWAAIFKGDSLRDKNLTQHYGAEKGKTSIKLGIIVGLIFGLLFIGKELAAYAKAKTRTIAYSDSLKREYTIEINGNRVSRLKQKIVDIEGRLLRPQAKQEADQLPVVADYFNRKAREIEVDQANRAVLHMEHQRYV
jgi:hypothetical protein